MDEQESHEFTSREFSSFDAYAPKNEQYFSPDATRTPPPRILSNQSLAGEDIVSSSRRHSSDHVDVELSPFTPSEATPPTDLQIPASLSPPPLTSNNIDAAHLDFQQSGQSAASPFRASGNSSSRPPRVPQISLHPNRNPENRHGRVSSNTDYSFLSGLTESPSDFSVPKRRTVSWDMNDPTARRDHTDRRGSPGATTNFSHKSTPAGLLQPVLVDESNRATPPRSIFTGRINTGIQNNRSGMQGTVSDLDFIPRIPDQLNSGTSDSFLRESTQRLQARRSLNRGQQIGSSNLQDTLQMKVGANTHGMDFTSGASETGTFVRTLEAGKQSHLDSDTGVSKRLSLREVLDAGPKEGSDETEVMKSLDLRKSRKTAPSVLPMVADSFAFDDGTEKTKNHSGTIISDAVDNLDALAKRLIEVSPQHRLMSSDESGHARAGHQRKTTRLFSDSNPEFLRSEKQDIEHGQPMPATNGSSTTLPSRQSLHTRSSRFWKKMKNDFAGFVDFMRPKQAGLREGFLTMFRLAVLPSFLVAVILFYFAGNPPSGKYEEGDRIVRSASASWWLLFIGVRQVVTLGLAILSEMVTIQFWTFRTRLFPRILGPRLSLLFAHSRGWPFQLCAWAFFDMLLLAGDNRFANHWLYWQGVVGLMNATNPSGTVVAHPIYYRALTGILVLGVAEAIKRAALGGSGGRRLVLRYREELAELMRKLIVISEIANLSIALESGSPIRSTGAGVEEIVKDDDRRADDSFDYSEAATMTTGDETPGRDFQSSGRTEVSYLLGEWDEPELQDADEEMPTMSSILQFRKTLGIISDEHPFSVAFGSALTREKCIQSSQELYDRLVTNSHTGGPHLEFDALCRIAKSPNNGLDRAKTRELVRIFRPNRTGMISKIEFVKSIDSVYKMLRMLVASINNASQIDRAYEHLVSICWYIVAFFLFLGVLGVDINSLFIFLSGLIVSFAFMIGSASSRYVEGLLFILVRRPYDIGDRIEIGTITGEASADGPTSSVIVEQVSLFSTTVRVGTTREVLSYANGSLAGTRIANLRRSERANVYMKIKFGVETTTGQVDEFRRLVVEYTKDRPREWVSVVAFRCNRVEVDLGFIEYFVALQHRDSWQPLPGILQSKGDFLSFALETQKRLGIHYSAPRVPIDLLPARDISSEPFQFERNDPDFESRFLEDKKDR